MSKKLVIVESPAKAKTIEKFLWPSFKVAASMWHIRNLPEKKLWVDIENDFEPEYIVDNAKKKIVQNLIKLAKNSNEVWIATDEDREWESIGWHLCNILSLDPSSISRIVFHEITKQAITDAVKKPRNIDIKLVDAQQARRILDRLVWYKVSPVLWQKIRKGLSAWRVQSVAVKLIVEKEKEIQNFKPEESWKVSVEFDYNNSRFITFFSKLDWKIKKLISRKDVEKLLLTLYDDINVLKEWKTKNDNSLLYTKFSLDFKLINTTKKDSKRKPWAPFTTSTLQQEAARKYNFWVKQTMIIAQRLYEWMDLWNWERQGLITYMRTDSLNLSKQALSQATEVIKENFWEKYHQFRTYKTKSSWAQEAHEAIRPTDFKKTPESLSKVLDSQQLKLYTLIWKRTLASQMSEAIVEVTTFIFSPLKSKKQEWIAKWEVIKFDGFMKLYIEWTDDEYGENDLSEWILPFIPVNTILSSNELNASQNFSRPPSRYTEASLVKKLESEWIWRPSTYAPTISTIIERWYIEKQNKKHLFPTDTAFTVTDFLEKYFSKMMEYKFTRKVEENFDEIALWKKTYSQMLDRFWNWSLKKDLYEASEKAEKIIEKVWENCPQCWKDLIYRYFKSWKFIWCSGFPECNYIDQSKEQKDELASLRAKYEWKPCPDWIEWAIVVKTGRYWPFLASNQYPRVKWIGKIKSDKEEILEEVLKEKWLLLDEISWEEMVIKNGRRWLFLAAKNYPKVKIIRNIQKDVWNEVNARLEKKAEEN